MLVKRCIQQLEAKYSEERRLRVTTTEMLFGTKLCPVNRKEMARLVGVNQSTISRWSQNPGAIPWDKMKLIIRIRGLSAEDLMKMAKER